MENKTSQTEKIICAAIHYPEINTAVDFVKNVNGLVILGRRHHDVIRLCYYMLEKRQAHMGNNIQGFITTKDRFVDRVEALQIARAANQILDEAEVRGNQLYSEDIY